MSSDSPQLVHTRFRIGQSLHSERHRALLAHKSRNRWPNRCTRARTSGRLHTRVHRSIAQSTRQCSPRRKWGCTRAPRRTCIAPQVARKDTHPPSGHPFRTHDSTLRPYRRPHASSSTFAQWEHSRSHPPNRIPRRMRQQQANGGFVDDAPDLRSRCVGRARGLGRPILARCARQPKHPSPLRSNAKCDDGSPSSHSFWFGPWLYRALGRSGRSGRSGPPGGSSVGLHTRSEIAPLELTTASPLSCTSRPRIAPRTAAVPATRTSA